MMTGDIVRKLISLWWSMDDDIKHSFRSVCSLLHHNESLCCRIWTFLPQDFKNCPKECGNILHRKLWSLVTTWPWQGISSCDIITVWTAGAACQDTRW